MNSLSLAPLPYAPHPSLSSSSSSPHTGNFPADGGAAPDLVSGAAAAAAAAAFFFYLPGDVL